MVYYKPQILYVCPGCAATKVATRAPKCSKCGAKMKPRPHITGG